MESKINGGIKMREIEEKILKSLDEDIKILKRANFKTDVSIYNWIKLNDYGYKLYTEVYIRKENISYYGIV